MNADVKSKNNMNHTYTNARDAFDHTMIKSKRLNFPLFWEIESFFILVEKCSGQVFKKRTNQRPVFLEVFICRKDDISSNHLVG